MHVLNLFLWHEKNEYLWLKAKAYLHEYVFIYYLMNIIMLLPASSLMCSMFKSSFMKHNPSLLLFLFIHRLEEIPQFHLLLFSVILSKMKINPLFYVRNVYSCVSVCLGPFVHVLFGIMPSKGLLFHSLTFYVLF